MDNSKLFENSYAEITLPFSKEAIGILRRIKSLDSIMDEYDELLKSPLLTDVHMELTVCFNFDSMETLFNVAVLYSSNDDMGSTEECNVHFDRKTADYFQNEALKHFLHNYQKIKEC